MVSVPTIRFNTIFKDHAKHEEAKLELPIDMFGAEKRTETAR
jgi:hypothetical protein